MLESGGVAIGDDLRGPDVVPEGGEPEFRDGSGIGGIRRELFILRIVLDGLFLAFLDLIRRWFCGSGDDREATFVQRLVQVEILRKRLATPVNKAAMNGKETKRDGLRERK